MMILTRVGCIIVLAIKIHALSGCNNICTNEQVAARKRSSDFELEVGREERGGRSGEERGGRSGKGGEGWALYERKSQLY
jgi:hypothetical protein